MKSIKTHIRSNKEMATKVENICTVKGLSDLTVATIVAETNGFELFDNQKQVVSYEGYDAVENQSGNQVSKAKISKKGNP
jgi:transposase